MLTCDVLVVGGGPAGLSAAKEIAQQGKKVIVLEKKQKIGSPVYCAEAIGSYLLPFVPFKIPERLLEWRIDGMVFRYKDIQIKKAGREFTGFSISRDKFEPWLAQQATKNGAKVFSDSELVEVASKGEIIKKAFFVHKQKRFAIVPKIVIAADGLESSVLKLCGKYKKRKGYAAPIHSWELKNVNLEFKNFEQIFVGDFAPFGYGYIFPKSKNSANLGVGSVYHDFNIDKGFKDFIEQPIVAKQIKKAGFVVEKSKLAPFEDHAATYNFGNVLAIGDAANQNIKPFVEGILPAIICGSFVGRNIDRVLDNSFDYSEIDHFFPLMKDSIHLTKIMDKILLIKHRRRYWLLLGLVSGIVHFDKLLEMFDWTDSKLQLFFNQFLKY